MWAEWSQLLTAKLGVKTIHDGWIFTPRFDCGCLDPPQMCATIPPLLVNTFSSSEHGGGQFTLLGLYVAESEPAREAVGHH